MLPSRSLFSFSRNCMSMYHLKKLMDPGRTHQRLYASSVQSAPLSETPNHHLDKMKEIEPPLTETQELDKFFAKINQLIDRSSRERNFAVVFLYGRQRFVREGDMFHVYKIVPANMGDRIKLEKCLLVGNENFTLVGRPILDRNLVHVEATVIEKAQSHTFMGLKHKKRSHGFYRYYFQRAPITVLRINEIRVLHHLNENHEVVE